MNYLDDEIFASFGLAAHDDVSGQYVVYEYNRSTSDDGEGFVGTYNEIFVGNVFVSSTQTELNVYLNDVIESRLNLSSVLVTNNRKMRSIPNWQSQTESNESTYTRYKIVLTLDGMAAQTKYVNVYLAYHYPTYSNNTDMIGLPEVDDASASLVMLLREGYDALTGESTLVPRIPYTEENYFMFGAFIMPTYAYLGMTNNIKFNLTDGVNVLNANAATYTTKQYFPQYTVFGNIYNNVQWQGAKKNNLHVNLKTRRKVLLNTVVQESIDEGVDRDIYAHDFLMDYCHKTSAETTEIWNRLMNGEEVVVYSTEDDAEAATVFTQASRYGDAYRDDDTAYTDMEVVVADVDYCPARYYLMWQDRFGGLQCQPFKGIDTYSESVSYTLIQNQYGNKRNGVADITPSWKLISEWISEDKYPIYESLFTSERVVLVDTESHVSQNVLISDTNYTEKTRKNNNRQLINFTVNVKLNKNQRHTH